MARDISTRLPSTPPRAAVFDVSLGVVYNLLEDILVLISPINAHSAIARDKVERRA
jgi:hypothetical protein